MPTYRVTAPDGRTVKITGDAPPNEADLEQIFSSLPAAPPAPGAQAGGAMTPEQRQQVDEAVDSTPLYLPGIGASVPMGVPVGIGKGIANTVSGLGRMIHKIPGVSPAVDAMLGQEGASQAAFDEARAATAPSTGSQKVGSGVEQAAEFFLVPGPQKLAGVARAVGLAGRGAKVAAGAATGTAAGGLALTQGSSPGAAVATGVLAGTPLAPAVLKVAEKAVRSVLKPTVAAMRRVVGTGVRGLDAKAEQMVRFVIDNGLTTPEKAQALLAATEQELQRVLAVKNAPTDAATRAVRYLDALTRNAGKAGMGREKVAALRDAAQEMLEGVMGKTVTRNVGGMNVSLRVPRTDVTAAEALESARASSRWSTRGTWGPKDSAESVRNAAEKAVEKAQRDAVKAAVPEAAPLLSREAQAIKAEEILARAAFREGNNSMTGVAGAVEVGTGRLPLLGFASKLLREGQLRGGVHVGRLAKAVQRGDVAQAVTAMKAMGIQIPADLLLASIPETVR
jgi:hypothetical protein